MIEYIKTKWKELLGDKKTKIVFSGELTIEEKEYIVANYDKPVPSYVFSEPNDIYELDRVVVLKDRSYYYVRSVLNNTTISLTEESFRLLFKKREKT